MKFELGTPVQHVSGSIPGVVIMYTPGIPEYKTQPGYMVSWSDGNESVHVESELTLLKAANDDCFEPAC
ncbi:hypothetical protein [Serratia phage X20]|uniref:DUF2158 domain-containing protein n=1 Tax=Serratia phage X20 TaxID=2006942 RepID=A0A1Z1LZD5_9CAUD|nr:hypothetical protein KNT72_gp205 [Serratia phage X20]ARW58183.1 hypothetical protein [Serratia phage X20]QYN80650.1 hypothetical protein [Kosakonia phage Kc304]UJJ22198.1 hypothetical protein [Erwinia phage Virsaitis27]UYM28859.1 hypothetical protein [Serratia phage vB_SspM_LC53]